MNPCTHPWHCIETGVNAPQYVKSIIEIPKGSKGKYEMDKATGLLRLDRVLFSSVIILQIMASYHRHIVTIMTLSIYL